MSQQKRRIQARHATWRRRLLEWKRSGLSQAAFCRQHGLRARQFSWWKQHLGLARPARTAPRTCDTVRVWVVIGDSEAGREIVFKYTESRTADAARDIPGAHAGYVQVDACGVYDGLFADGTRVEAGCWSHVYRQFEEVAPADARARPMPRLIGKLYGGEDAADEANLTPEARLASRPLLLRIGAWVAEQRDREFLESSFKKALNYVANQWVALKRFLEDGRPRLGRVEDWRGGGSTEGVAVASGFRSCAGASVPGVAPFPVPAHRTGRAVFPHPALIQDIKPSHSAARCADRVP